MDETSDIDGIEGGVGAELDPREAVRLLEQTGREVRRQFGLFRPLLSLIAAAVFMVAYGAIWLSVRGQHPYVGPDGAALAVVIGAVIGAVLASAVIIDRTTTGVSGRSVRQRRGYIAALLVGYIAVYVLEGALAHAGARHAIAYGLFAAVAPVLVFGTVGAVSAVGREDWPLFAAALVVMAISSGGAFAGPVGVWEVTGLGGTLTLLGGAGAELWRERR